MALRSVDFNTETVTREARIEHLNILILKPQIEPPGQRVVSVLTIRKVSVHR